MQFLKIYHNLNILLFLISSIICYGKDLFNTKLYFLDKFILLFFAYTLITSFYNNVFIFSSEKEINDFTIIIKSLLYLRFLILYFIIKYLIEKNLLNFKYFFISCSISSLFVCLDLIYQFNYGKDIFGYIANARRRN